MAHLLSYYLLNSFSINIEIQSLKMSKSQVPFANSKRYGRN